MKNFHFHHPKLLQPAFDMQITMMQAAMGADFWWIRKTDLEKQRQDESVLQARLKVKQLAMIEKQRQAAIRRDMGEPEV